MFSIETIREICAPYAIAFDGVREIKDTSRGEADRRYACFLDERYVLKLTNAPDMHEARLEEIAGLIERYRATGLYAPRLIENRSGEYSREYVMDNIRFLCYVEEYAQYSVCTDEIYAPLDFKKTVVAHLGAFAAKYTGAELTQQRSMWSIIDLAPLDADVDEKQENLNLLVETLSSYGRADLARALAAFNGAARERIKARYLELPRCVFQGDLNSSNLLTDENGRFVGLIDFNLCGTEVNINCFLNETMYFMERSDFEGKTAREVFQNALRYQDALLDVILQHYALNDLERALTEDYRRVILCSFYPNIMLWRELLKEGAHAEAVCGLIEEILRY